MSLRAVPAVSRRHVHRATGALIAVLCLLFALTTGAVAQDRDARKWVATWSASVHGPYPSGNATAGPDMRFAFPTPQAIDQSFRMMVRPDLWGREVRFRFSNVFGDKPFTLDGVHVGLQAMGGNVTPGTNRKVSFGGKSAVTIPAGQSLWSDPTTLSFVEAKTMSLLDGKRLAVSFHVVGNSGAITDGTNTTMNGDDRWGDVLSRRLKAAYGNRWVVVNQGIGGNQVAGPATYTVAQPFAGGPSALDRLDRDIFGLSGLSAIIMLEGINDFGTGKASAETVIAGMREVVRRVRARGGIKIYAATATSSLNSTNAAYGTAEVDQKRRALNDFIRSAGIFDGVFDFDAVTIDRATGTIRTEFQPNSTVGGPGDLLHPNRAGLQAMGNAVDIAAFAPAAMAKTKKR